MKSPNWTQSAAERDKMLEHVETAGSGYIFVLDLEHPEGRRAADKLKIYEDVVHALTVRREQKLLHCRYMMVLLPFVGDGHAVVAFATEDRLMAGIELLHERSQDFGRMFGLIVCPPDPQIKARLAKLEATVGSA